jgi:sulfhydrogenase subunit beta (sulfur reductase)
MPSTWSPGQQLDFLPKSELGPMIEALQKEGYTVLGPVHADGVLSLRPINAAGDLARGVCDEQSPGRYRVVEGDPDLYFQHVVGPHSPKRYLFPPTQFLFGLHVEGTRFVVDQGPPEPPKLAFLGVRSCELAAMDIQDCIFGAHDPRTFRCESNPYYTQTRQNALIIAVNCTKPGGNCFCASMGTGPVAQKGFDLAMTELRAGFVVEVGSPRGAALIRKLAVREPSPAELELAELRLAQAKTSMGREMDTEGLAEALEYSIEHPHWAEVAKRCLGCGNCTMVCPTCSCSSMRDSSDVNGQNTARQRDWESCFTHQFSYTTGGTHRTSIRARYRHRVRHKLSTWGDQHGGGYACVGCGRCITWCPVGIDITEEVAAIRYDHPRPAEPVSAPARKGVLK